MFYKSQYIWVWINSFALKYTLCTSSVHFILEQAFSFLFFIFILSLNYFHRVNLLRYNYVFCKSIIVPMYRQCILISYSLTDDFVNFIQLSLVFFYFFILTHNRKWVVFPSLTQVYAIPHLPSIDNLCFPMFGLFINILLSNNIMDVLII